MVIDTHQHFWKYELDKHAWIDENMKQIRRDFLPADLEPELKANGIDGCIAVQADQTEAENNFLIKLSKENKYIKGITGWVDFKSDKIEERLDYYSDFEIMKGFRHIVQGESDPNFLLRKDFSKGISNLEKHRFIYEILVFPYQLGSVLEFVRKFPNQLFIIDHIAKPYIKDGFMEGWKLLITEIAKSENVYCKISGMITEADYESWTFTQLQPYIDIVLDSFGTKRLMFGSDWPVCLVAGDYFTVKELADKTVIKFSEKEKENFWSTNAIQFYNL
ncbi:amidohydrolase family protein [Zunongwangia endophytica]|uniref:Amidohydrolase family protein n=1 Tax=Zunongwangia endophytica TaxID=1808945 RepID=A0ABV8H6F8_9FLAO|nr:amidohydrolase family protein [Zunongwangia endophytica]MDN3594813.1 amidohydrolase family protein [Zunongwangia endophytica]